MKQMTLLGIVTVLCAGCLPGVLISGQTTTGSGSGGQGSGSNGSSGMITVPDVFGMPKERAVAELRRAGIQGSIVDDSSLCGSIVEGRIIEIGQVCYQHPVPGRVQGARLPISLRVQTENPWHGNIGEHTEWRLMPKLVGMGVEQARAEMQRVGFHRDDRIYVQWVDKPGCKPLTVCETHPSAMTRVGLASNKVISVGRDPNAPPPATPPPTPDARDVRSIEPADPPDADTAAPEPTPEPFF